MNKREMAILEKAYDCEVMAALNGRTIHFMQTKSKLAEKLVDNGLLQKVSMQLQGSLPCTVNGYELTHAGRLAYCASCNA